MEARIEEFVDAIFADLESSFLVLPKTVGFVEYVRFQEAYETLKRWTVNFTQLSPETVWQALEEDSLALVIVCTILGFTAPEWAYLSSAEAGVQVSQSAARTIDSAVRMRRDYVLHMGAARDDRTARRIRALVELACRLIAEPAAPGAADAVHRLNKADTADGVASVRRAAAMGVPYAVLLYERYLGRPFASARDAASEIVGDVMESAVESRLADADISCRKTKRAERIAGFDQAPDFIVPDEYAPAVVIEAKITNDGGTARDKVARLLRLVQFSEQRAARGENRFEVVACIDGRGFGVRREDMRQLIRAVNGKVFTLRTLDQLVAHTRLRDFAYAQPI